MNQMPWQPIMQPALGTAQHLYMARFEPNFLVELTIERINRHLMPIDAPLGKLPAILPDPTGPEDLPRSIAQNNPYIKSKSV